MDAGVTPAAGSSADSAAGGAAGSALARTTIVLLCAAALLSLAVRVAPLFEGGERLRWQGLSEDGYLMMTIARNVALGHGMSVSDGLVKTNGTQPLTTLLFAGAYKLAGGDRIAGLYGIVALQLLVAVLTSLVLYLAMKSWLYRGPHPQWIALAAALSLFASPTAVMYGHNGLETGLYLLFMLVSVGLYQAWRKDLGSGKALIRCLALGIVLGLTFLVRNDACFLIAVLLTAHLAMCHRDGQPAQGLLQCLTIGTVSVLVASPWLYYNMASFGHLVPVSGRAEAHDISFGHNLSRAFVALAENISVFLRVPERFEFVPAVNAACAALLLIACTVAFWRRRWLAERFTAGTAILAVTVLVLIAYYALFFGMPSFLGRYYFPATLLAAIVFAAVAAPHLCRTSAAWRLPVFAAAVVALSVASWLNVRIYWNGTSHQHAQVVRWISANVDPRVWVGAVQTGTLGYYHDRTINLDGKVDPMAFEYRKRGRTADYAVSRGVEYIADWAGISVWAELPAYKPHYRLIVHDKDRNLAVLRLRTAN